MIKFNELGINLNTKELIIDVSVKDNTYYENVYIDKIYIDTQDTYKDGGPSSKAKEIDIVSKATEKIVYTPIDIVTYAIGTKTYRLEFPIKNIRNYVLNLETLDTASVEFIDSTGASYTFSHPHYGTKYNVFEFKDEALTLVEDGDTLDTLTSTFKIAKHAREILNTIFLESEVSSTMYFVYIKAIGTPGADTPCGNDKEYTLGITLNTSVIYNNMMMYIHEIAEGCSIPKEFINYYLEFEALRLSINTGHNMQAIKYFNKFFKRNIDINNGVKNCSCYG